MPFTQTPQDAIDFVKKYVKDIPFTTIDSQICDDVSNIMYTAWPWRWTIQNITPGSIPLVDGTQDYNVPTNLYRLLRARITRTDTTPDEYHDISISEFIPPCLTSTGIRAITSICHEESLGKLRLSQAVSIASGETYELQGEYQLNPTKITDSNLGTTLWFPDQYFPVFKEGMKWKLYEYADDARAGNVSQDRFGHRQITGQMGKFYAALDEMKQQEDYGSGMASEFPDEPLGVGNGGGFNLYGF